MCSWVYPADGEHPYREMIVPYNGYTIQQDDLDKLNIDGKLYADNIEKYAFISYEGKTVMVLAVDVVLDKDKLSFVGENMTGQTSLSVYNEPFAESVRTTRKSRPAQNPRTGSHIFWLFAAAIASALCMLILTSLQIRKKKETREKD